MNLDLRQAVIQRVIDKSEDDLAEIIADSIGGAEQVLPGLGVIFEMIWQHSEKTAQQQMVSVLKNQLH